MKRNRLYIFILVLSVLAFALSEIFAPKEIDWNDSFTGYDKKPYGAQILRSHLSVLFPDSNFSINSSSVFTQNYDTSGAKNWIFINNTLGFDEYETRFLLNSVENGSQVFLAANMLSPQLSDTLHLSFNQKLFLFDSTGIDETLKILNTDSISVNFTNPALSHTPGWFVPARSGYTYISGFDSLHTVVLGEINGEHINFIKIPWGKGAFFIHANPRLFTNYFLRKPEYIDYAFTSLSYLPKNQMAIWDEYYKTGRISSHDLLKVIRSTKYLAYAWYISIIGILLFMIFQAKRKQRIIPVLEKPINSSITFAKTIGELYLEKSSHKDILEKKITFFMEYLRANLRIETQHIDDQTKLDISRRSGMEETTIFSLFDMIELLRAKPRITEKELIMATQQIDRFYKHSLR